jgi:hypothetical protein
MGRLVRLPADNAAAVAGCAAFACMFAAGHLRATPYNNFVLLADAWLHGHSWIAFPGDYIDAVPYHGKAYIVEGPTPAVLLLPAVALLGMQANQSALAYILGALAVYAAWRICRLIGLGTGVTLAAVAFFFFGTSLFACATLGDVWLLAHVSAACFTLLALAELFGKRRAWLVACWGVAAAFSRFPLVLALAPYLVWLLVRGPRRAVIAQFVAPILPAALLAAWYDLARWGTLQDRGYAIWYRVMDERYLEDPHLFSLAYVPRQLSFAFGSPPSPNPSPPWLVPPAFGMGLQYTSLPFAYALFAGASLEAALLWFATLATLLPSLTYFDVGPGYGVRHALDFEPFLFALLALALRRRASRIVLALLGAETAFGVVESLAWLAAH